MTPTEINRAIAELCGWKLHRETGKLFNDMAYSFVCAYPRDGTTNFDGEWISWSDLKPNEFTSDNDIPNYHASLDACAEFERTIRDDYSRSCYAETLSTVRIGEELDDLNSLEVFETATASAPQRCEAFLRLHEKWEESK